MNIISGGSESVVSLNLFSGGGGSSVALRNLLQGRLDLTAVNHWGPAIKTHALNHPQARHFCEAVETLNPVKLFPRRKLHILWGSPPCTHFSNARGGVPKSDQMRSSAWRILDWAEALRADRIVVENVPEWADWGPLDDEGKPIPELKGTIFKAFVRALESLGYRVEHRILSAADFGDPTSRRRLFLLARRAGAPIYWPAPEFSRNGDPTLFGPTLPWRTASDVINWDIKGQPLLRRQRKLTDKTIERIEFGLQRFGRHQPFILKYYGSGGYSMVDEPLDTLTTKDRFGLVQPVGGDIHYRMLQVSEMAAAMSFPSEYRFVGNHEEVVRQIGNAVPVRVGMAVCRAMFLN